MISIMLPAAQKNMIQALCLFGAVGPAEHRGDGGAERGRRQGPVARAEGGGAHDVVESAHSGTTVPSVSRLRGHRPCGQIRPATTTSSQMVLRVRRRWAPICSSGRGISK